MYHHQESGGGVRRSPSYDSVGGCRARVIPKMAAEKNATTAVVVLPCELLEQCVSIIIQHDTLILPLKSICRLARVSKAFFSTIFDTDIMRHVFHIRLQLSRFPSRPSSLLVSHDLSNGAITNSFAMHMQKILRDKINKGRCVICGVRTASAQCQAPTFAFDAHCTYKVCQACGQHELCCQRDINIMFRTALKTRHQFLRDFTIRQGVKKSLVIAKRSRAGAHLFWRADVSRLIAEWMFTLESA